MTVKLHIKFVKCYGGSHGSGAQRKETFTGHWEVNKNKRKTKRLFQSSNCRWTLPDMPNNLTVVVGLKDHEMQDTVATGRLEAMQWVATNYGDCEDVEIVLDRPYYPCGTMPPHEMTMDELKYVLRRL